MLTKADVGLNNVDNTADGSKPVSTAQAAADSAVAAAAAADATSKANAAQAAAIAAAAAAAPALAPVQSVAGRAGAVVLTKADVGLSNVDNTADGSKPVSTAQAAADSAVAAAAAADATSKANAAQAAAIAAAAAAAPALAPVQSVAGRTGAVVLTKADVGLSNVDNTADGSKPVSTAQAAADLAVAVAAAADATSKANAAQAAAIAAAAAAAPALAPVQSVAGRTGAVVLTLADLTDSTPAGRALAAAIDATAQRVLLGLGNSATRNVGTTAGTVAAGDDARLSDARTPTSHTHPASEISDSTSPGRALLTAADAAAQRTALGLGTAAVRPDTAFPRFDAVQAPSVVEVVRIRANIGNARPWTCAELDALSDADAASLGYAWCPDCVTLGRHFMGGTGDWVDWDETELCWKTRREGVPAVADFHSYVLHKGRQNRAGFVGPWGAEFGDIYQLSASQIGYTNGSGAAHTSAASDPTNLSQLNGTPGSTSGGSARGAFLMNNYIMNSAPIRDFGLCFGFRPTATALSASGETWHWRFGLTEPIFNSGASLTSNEAVILMDDQNTLGRGATGTTLRAFTRVNGVDVDWVDTGLNPTTNTTGWFVITWEPTGPNVREGTLKISMAPTGGGSMTPLVSRSNVIWGGAITGLQASLLLAKTSGTGSRFVVRKTARVITRRRDNTAFTAELE